MIWSRPQIKALKHLFMYCSGVYQSPCLLSQGVLDIRQFSVWQLTKSSLVCVGERGGARASVHFGEWRSGLYGSVHTNSIPHAQTLVLNKYQTESDKDMTNQKRIIVSKANRLKVTKYFGSEPCWGNQMKSFCYITWEAREGLDSPQSKTLKPKIWCSLTVQSC